MGHGTPSGYLRIAEIIHEAVLRDMDIEMPLEIRIIE
jgi:UDP-N-acetylenolpyruvoylglucosamine reductase